MYLSPVQIYKRLLRAARPYWWAFMLGILGNALIAISDGCITYYFKPLIERGFIQRDSLFIQWIPIAIILFFMARGVAYFLANYFMSWVGRSVVRDFRRKMISHLMKLPATYYDNKTIGELLSKINYDTDQVAEAISEAITSTIRGMLTTLSMVYVMYELNSRITSILLIAMPILAIYISKISRRMRKQSGQIQVTMGRVTHVAGEVINGYKVIKNFGGIEYENQRFAEASAANWIQEMKIAATSSSSVIGMQLIGVCALALFLFLATIEPGHFLGTHMSIGEFAAMATAILGLLRPIKQVAVVNSTLQRGIAGARSIFSLLDEKPEENSGTKRLVRARGEIIFDNVYFDYQKINPHGSISDNSLKSNLLPNDLVSLVSNVLEQNDLKFNDLKSNDFIASDLKSNDLLQNDLSATDLLSNDLLQNDDSHKNVLHGINIIIKPGETIALVGRSGSGKSTLASLLPRFYDCQKGCITLDGIDIKDFELNALRRQFALVTQQVTLFNDTIANNIAYGDMRNASFESIRHAAELAYALEFIERLPNGFETEIGENGIRLSGGQRQRIAIARAILKDAPILILDEATSALDSESEKYIQAALETLMQERTTLVIAHRLSTIERADKVLVLEQGRIVECGKHSELIKQNGRYATLHRAHEHVHWTVEV